MPKAGMSAQETSNLAAVVWVTNRSLRLYFFTAWMTSWFALKMLGGSKLSKKFQVTIPRRAREFLRVNSGDLLVFLIEKNAVVVRRGELRIR
jgi:hypothetical protein